MDKVLALMRPFMKKELLDVMHLHSTMDTFLEKYVPNAMMPNEYGGSAGTVKEIQGEIKLQMKNVLRFFQNCFLFFCLTESTFKQLQENNEYFVEEEATKRVNEKLRPGKPKNANDLFGIDGNFKQLNFD